MVEQVFPFLIFGSCHDPAEVDIVFEHANQRIVLMFEHGDGLVEHSADVVLQVLERERSCAIPV